MRLKSGSPIQVRQAAFYALAAGVIGAVVWAVVSAAGPLAAFEPESGALSGGATSVAVTGASGGHAVKFGTPAPTPTPPPGGFAHPGMLESRAQLDYIKAQIAAGATPATAAFNQTKSSHFASATYAPAPVATIDCTADNAGCQAEQEDAIAAYTQALLWYYTGNRAYAQKSIQIMNAWSSTMTGSNGNQAHLNQAWVSESFPRAAEIIRYTFTPAAGETALNVTAFSSMLTNVIMPQIVAGSAQANNSSGNWELSMIEGQMNIAIFIDNHQLFDDALPRWRARVKSYIYLTSDGAVPHPVPGTYMNDPIRFKCSWSTPAVDCTVPPNFQYMNGQSMETCRDISHVILGFEAMVGAAEVARNQGVDLYGEEKTRITAGYEFAARYDAATLDGGAIPATLCNGQPLNQGGSGYTLGWEIAYNAYARRLGVSMPYTQGMVNRLRPTKAVLHMDWESLTSVGN